MKTTTHDIHDIAAEFDRLSPSQVDHAKAANSQRQSGHVGHDIEDRADWWAIDGTPAPLVGWETAGGNAGNPVVAIHPDDIDKAHGLLASMPDGAIDTGSIQDIEQTFADADIRCEWCY